MGTKKNNIICFIMIICFVLSGMYCKNIKSVCDFSCAPVEKTSSYIEKTYATITDVQACTTEMSGMREKISGGQLCVRKVASKRNVNSSLQYLCSNIVSLNERKFFTGLNLIQYCNCINAELVTNYIHKSDGKKRI